MKSPAIQKNSRQSNDMRFEHTTRSCKYQRYLLISMMYIRVCCLWRYSPVASSRDTTILLMPKTPRRINPNDRYYERKQALKEEMSTDLILILWDQNVQSNGVNIVKLNMILGFSERNMYSRDNVHLVLYTFDTKSHFSIYYFRLWLI